MSWLKLVQGELVLAGSTFPQYCHDRFDAKAMLHGFRNRNALMCVGSWGLFRDRRPDLYENLLTHDGYSNNQLR
jgi:hypothetical protein